MKKQNVTASQGLPSEKLLMTEGPTGKEIQNSDTSLTEKFKQLVRVEEVRKLVHYENTDRVSECFIFHMKDFSIVYNFCELFYLIE